MKINGNKAAKISLLIVFLALIRSIGEFFRLRYVHGTALTIEMVRPFMAAAMVCAVSLMFMNVLFFYSKFRWVTLLAFVAVGVLFFLKYYYQLK